MNKQEMPGLSLNKEPDAQVDLLRGFFGGFVRGVLEDRVERQASLIVQALRARLESGNPPDEASDLVVSERRGVH
jgi:hypothetical protein